MITNMDYKEKLTELKTSLARENLDTYMRVEQNIQEKGTAKENLLEYVDTIKHEYQEMKNHADNMPNDIQNGSLVSMILSQEFMRGLNKLHQNINND